MPLLSRLFNHDSTDSFQRHGRTDVIFPLEHHDLFQWYLYLVGLLGKTCCWRPPVRYLKVDPAIFDLLIDLVVDVLRRFARASYGGNCLPGTTGLRDGAFTELGLTGPPPIYDFVRLFHDHQPFTGGSHVDQEELMKWSDWFMQAVEGTKRWVFSARLRASSRPNGWNWGPATLDDETIGALGYDPRDSSLSWGGSWQSDEPSRAVIPHPVLGPGAQNALVPYHPFPIPTITTFHPPCTELIPHPVVGSGAQNALVGHQRYEDTAPNLCTTLIPHPVLGPGAQNGMVLYRPLSTTSGLFKSLPAYDDPEHYEVSYDCSTEQYLEQGLLRGGDFGTNTDDIVRAVSPKQHGI